MRPSWKQLGLFFLLWVTLAHPAAAHNTFKEVPADQYEEIFVTTADGVTEKLIHLKNPCKPRELMFHGLGANGTSLEHPAIELWRKGTDVFIANWRGAEEIPSGNILGRTNRLEDIVRYDFDAHFDYVYGTATAEQKESGIGLYGHSLGGIIIAGRLTDPEGHAKYAPHISSVVLHSMHHVKYLGFSVRMLARVGLPLLNYLEAHGVDSIDIHSRGFEWSKKIKQEGPFVSRAAVVAAENLVVALVHQAFSGSHQDLTSFRRLFFKMPAKKIPLSLLRDLGKAVLNGGLFWRRDGTLLIRPEAAFKGIPTLLLSTELDNLGVPREQKEYWSKLDPRSRAWIRIKDMGHIGPVTHTRKEANFYHYVIDFKADPLRFTANDPVIEFDPCVSLLTKVKIRLLPPTFN